MRAKYLRSLDVSSGRGLVLAVLLRLLLHAEPACAAVGLLEDCLRELDADLVGLGRFNVEGTIDAAVGAARPWWGRWTHEREMLPPTGGCSHWFNSRFIQQMTAPTKVNLRSAFNKCDVVLNSDRFSRDQELQKMPPLVLIIDPRTADPALRTIEALRHVQDIETTSLEIFLDDCGPPDAGWDQGMVELCSSGVSDLFVERISKVDFMRVVLRGIVPSDSMLLTLPVKSSRWSVRLWNKAAATWPEYLKIRAMHAMREVLFDNAPPELRGPARHTMEPRHLSLILLEAGCLPLRSFLRFHTAARKFMHRTAVVAVSSVAPPEAHMQQHERATNYFEHPCQPDLYLLSDSLAQALTPEARVKYKFAGTGGSLGLNRRAFLELYTTLAMHQTLGLREALQWLQLQHAQSRFFLHPAALLSVELQIAVDGSELRGSGAEGEGGDDEACHVFGRFLGLSQEGGHDHPAERFEGRENVQARPGEALSEQEAARDEVSMEECAVHGWAPRLSPRKVYDAVTYLQEEQMLLLRMHELNHSVDVHVVVEGDLSFRGDAKSRHLHQRAAMFAPFSHKVRVVEATLAAHPDISCPVISPDLSCSAAADAYETDVGDGHPREEALKGSWTSGYRNWFKREWYTRHTMAWGLWDAGPDDLILMGDVDEIPRADLVKALKWCDGGPLALGMTSRWFQYNASFQKADWFLTPNAILFRALGHGEAGFARPDGANGVSAGTSKWIRTDRRWDGGDMSGWGISSKALRCYGFWHLIPWIEDAGWHLSYFGDTKSFLNKISSFSDEVELDVVTGDRINALVAQGVDLHSFLESLRQPGRTPGHGVHQLLRTTDFSVLPAFLTSTPDAFSFRFSHAGSTSEHTEQGQSEVAEEGSGVGWRDCRPAWDPAVQSDHSSLLVSSCAAEGLDMGASGTQTAGFARVQLHGACDLPPRPWPPAAPCFLPLGSPAHGWRPGWPALPSDAGGGMPVSKRPVVIVWKILPVGGPTRAADLEHFRAAVQAWHESAVQGCAHACVSLQGGDEFEGDACHTSGYADLAIFGKGSAGDLELPMPAAFKGQREMWGFTAPPMHVRTSSELMGKFSPSAFDFDISREAFPELFPTARSPASFDRGWAGGSGGSEEAGVSICRLCESVRLRIHERCRGEKAVPGRRADAPHVLIMLPQNGHAYSASNLLLVYRVANAEFLVNSTEATIDIVGRQEQVLAVDASFMQTRTVLSETPRVEQFRFVVPHLESGFWEVHVTLLDARRRPLSSDHILFKTH